MKERKERKGRRRKERKDSKERKKRKERKEQQARRQEGKKGRKIKEEKEEKKEREERKERNSAVVLLRKGAVRKPQAVPAVTSTGLRRSLCLSTGHFRREAAHRSFGNDLDTNPAPGSRPCPNLSRTQSRAEHRDPLYPQPAVPAAQSFPQGCTSRSVLGCDASLAPVPSSLQPQPQLQLSSLVIPPSVLPSCRGIQLGADGSPENHVAFAFSILFPSLEQKEIRSVKSNSSWALSLENGLCKTPDIKSLL